MVVACDQLGKCPETKVGGIVLRAYLRFLADIEPDVFASISFYEIEPLAVLYTIHIVTHVLHEPVT
jgi:hypothetical protein